VAWLFVRDDDVGALTEPLRRFVEAFLARRIPVSYQIIPAKLTDECAAWLTGLWRAHPDLIEFGQHGLTHEMTVRGKHSWREFGPEKSLAEQTEIVAEGAARLRAALGEAPVRLFTPPQHKYDGNTVRAVAAAGYGVLSGASYASPQHRIAYAAGRALGLSSIRHHGISYHGRRRPEAAVTELSIAVAVDDGGRVTTPAAALAGAIAKAAAKSDKVGLMFHHQVYASRPEELDAIADALAAVGAERFRLLSSLA
jgi:hypothetical protein